MDIVRIKKRLVILKLEDSTEARDHLAAATEIRKLLAIGYKNIVLDFKEATSNFTSRMVGFIFGLTKTILAFDGKITLVGLRAPDLELLEMMNLKKLQEENITLVRRR